MVIKSGASSHSRRRSETPHHRRRQPERHRQKFTHISATGRRALKHSRLDGSFLHDSSPGAKRTRLRRQRSLHDIVDSLRRPECDAQPLNSPFPLSLSSHTSRSHITHHPHDTSPMQTAHRSYHASARQPSSKYKTLDTRRSAQHATCERAAILLVVLRSYIRSMVQANGLTTIYRITHALEPPWGPSLRTEPSPSNDLTLPPEGELLPKASAKCEPARPEFPTYSAPVQPPLSLRKSATSLWPERFASSRGVLPCRRRSGGRGGEKKGCFGRKAERAAERRSRCVEGLEGNAAGAQERAECATE